MDPIKDFFRCLSDEKLRAFCKMIDEVLEEPTPADSRELVKDNPGIFGKVRYKYSVKDNKDLGCRISSSKDEFSPAVISKNLHAPDIVNNLEQSCAFYFIATEFARSLVASYDVPGEREPLTLEKKLDMPLDELADYADDYDEDGHPIGTEYDQDHDPNDAQPTSSVEQLDRELEEYMAEAEQNEDSDSLSS